MPGRGYLKDIYQPVPDSFIGEQIKDVMGVLHQLGPGMMDTVRSKRGEEIFPRRRKEEDVSIFKERMASRGIKVEQEDDIVNFKEETVAEVEKEKVNAKEEEVARININKMVKMLGLDDSGDFLEGEEGVKKATTTSKERGFKGRTSRRGGCVCAWVGRSCPNAGLRLKTKQFQ